MQLSQRSRHGGFGSPKLFSASFLSNCQDCFGFLFPTLVTNPNNVLERTASVIDLLKQLGDIMAEKPDTASTNSQIPSGFTFLGQFIDHDITLEPFSSINDDDILNGGVDPNTLRNFRTPLLDLDCVYGRGPFVEPHYYDYNTGNPLTDGIKLLLGQNRPNGTGGPESDNGHIDVPTDYDVPRNVQGTAMIGDPRNDENIIVSQMQHAFLKFHNAVVDYVLGTGFSGTREELFNEAKALVTHHYQYVVLHDFLSRIVGPQLVQDTLTNGLRFFSFPDFIMPVEFSAAGYRFGHSLIRNSFGINSNFPNASLIDAFTFVQRHEVPLPSNRAIDFNRYFETGSNKPVNFAKKIDTHLAGGLEGLLGESGIFKILAIRNLLRGLAFGLPTGQAVAHFIGETPLSANQLIQGHTSNQEIAILSASSSLLRRKTPLWFYILKEAEVLFDGERLGPVGGTILVETFVRMLRENENSILNLGSTFVPSLPRVTGTRGSGFTMVDLLHFAKVLGPQPVPGDNSDTLG